MSFNSGTTKTENITASEDWNQLIESSGEEQQGITFNHQNHWHAKQREIENKDTTLYKTLNKIIQKKKNIHANVKIPGNSKLNPIPNLTMARNRNKKGEGNQPSDLSQVNNLKDINDEIKLAELTAENKLLKAEIQKLLNERSNEGNPDTNIQISNRFEALDTPALTSVTQEVEMIDQDPDDFVVYLKKKNNQQEVTTSEGKLKYSAKEIRTAKKNVSAAKQLKHTQDDPRKIRRKDRPPPINILYQDPRNTTKLLKSNIKDIKDFYIKRINNGKHVLQIDTLENYRQVKELLIKCNSKFYTYTDKSEKIITLLLKGLDSAYLEEEILAELRSLSISDVNFVKVIRFTTPKSKINNKVLPIFIVQLTPESKINNLKKIKYLFHQVIHWEKLMRRDTIQCKKCQRIGSHSLKL